MPTKEEVLEILPPKRSICAARYCFSNSSRASAPRLRPARHRQLPLRLFWDHEHLLTTAALAGLVGARQDRRLLALAVPYVAKSINRRGPGARAPITSALELPGQLVRQSAEVAGMAAGSVRHRTTLL